jgi:hypothetical protein
MHMLQSAREIKIVHVGIHMHMLTHYSYYCVNTRQKLAGRPPGSKNRLKRAHANDGSELDEEQEMPASAQMQVSKDDEDSNVRTRTWHESIALVFERTLCLLD